MLLNSLRPFFLIFYGTILVLLNSCQPIENVDLRKKEAAQTAPALALESVFPDGGAIAGGTRVKILGNGFVQGAIVRFGGALCSGVLVLNLNQLTCTTPPGTLGFRDVAVFNPDGTGVVGAGLFRYRGPPVVSQVRDRNDSDPNGPDTGGSPLRISGTGFGKGIEVKLGGTLCKDIKLISSSVIECNSPAHVQGLVDVVVTNPEGQSGIKVGAFSFIGTPFVSSYAPTGGIPSGGGVTVEFFGANLLNGAIITFGNKNCLSYDYSGAPSNIKCLAVPGGSGFVTVNITNPDGFNLFINSGYTYRNPPGAASIVPNGGSTLGGQTVTITGTGFVSGATVKFDGSFDCTSVEVINSSSLKCITPVHSLGLIDVKVLNPDLQEIDLLNSYTYQVAPSVSSILNPSSGEPSGSSGGNQNITFVGAGFKSGVQISLGGSDCQVQGGITPTSFVCKTGPSTVGVVDAVVTNSDGQKVIISNGFEFKKGPSVSSVFPRVGRLLGGSSLTIIGSDFKIGATVLVGAAPCNQVTVLSSIKINCVTTSSGSGLKDLKVFNPDKQVGILENSYIYRDTPQISSVDPDEGPTLGGNTISILGNNFSSEVRVLIGGQVCLDAETVNSSLIRCTPPIHPYPGIEDVKVTNLDDLQEGVLPGGYVYILQPILASVKPSGGPILGSSTVTLVGGGFRVGIQVLIGGKVCSAVNVLASNTLTCVTPDFSESPGFKDVVLITTDGQTTTLRNGFEYLQPPVVSSVTPNNGIGDGGFEVTVRGARFLPGAKVFLGDTQCLVASLDENTIRCFSNKSTQSTVDVIVTNPEGQFEKLLSGFTFIQAPIYGNINPSSGKTAGGEIVTVSGLNFNGNTGFKILMDGTPCSINSSGSTSVTCVTPEGKKNGSINIEIINPDGQSGFGILAYEYIGAPEIGIVTPNGGPITGGGIIEISGANFISGGLFEVLIDGEICTGPSIIPTRINCTVPVGTLGGKVLRVTNSDGQFRDRQLGYSYQGEPILNSLLHDPSQGFFDTSGPNGGVRIKLEGDNFLKNAIVKVLVNPGNPADLDNKKCTDVKVLSKTELTCLIPEDPNFPSTYPISYQLRVENVDGQAGDSGFNLFTYQEGPTISQVNPAEGIALNPISITITGDLFLAGAVVTVGGVLCESPLIATNTIGCTLRSFPQGGTFGVQVTNPDGQVAILPQSYSFRAVPIINKVDPVFAPLNKTENIIIRGKNFLGAPGSVIVTLDPGGLNISCSPITLVKEKEIHCVAQSSSLEKNVKVKVVNSDGQTGTSGLEVFQFKTPPTFLRFERPELAESGLSIISSQGPLGGGFVVEIFGSNFQPGIIVKIGGKPCFFTNYLTPTKITCVFPANIAGFVDLYLENPDKVNNTIVNAFEYNLSPFLDSISPIAGKIIGGSTLVLGGRNFKSGSKVLVGGLDCSNLVFINSTEVRCTLPVLNNDGLVDVTYINPDGQKASLSNSYTYQSAPIINSVIPPYGKIAGGDIVNLFGDFLDPVGGSNILVGGFPCIVQSKIKTLLRCEIPVSNISAGQVDVQITNTVDGQVSAIHSLTKFEYRQPPSITNLKLTSVTKGNLLDSLTLGTLFGGKQIGGETLEIHGNNFHDDTPLILLGNSPCSGVQRVSSSKLTCAVPPGVGFGPVTVMVTNLDGQASNSNFKYYYLPPPTIDSLKDGLGDILAVMKGRLTGFFSKPWIEISGKNFISADGVLKFGLAECNNQIVLSGGISCSGMDPYSDLTFDGGDKDIVWTNYDGQSVTIPNRFTFLKRPKILSISPTEWRSDQATSVILNGKDFFPTDNIYFGNSNVTGNCTFNSENVFTCSIAANSPAFYQVRLLRSGVPSHCPSGEYCSISPTDFRFIGKPSVTSISPVRGFADVASNPVLKIFGNNFVDPVAGFMGGDAMLGCIRVSDSEINNCIPPSKAKGNYDISVTNKTGSIIAQTSTNNQSYEYRPPPNPTSLNKLVFATHMEETLVINGSDFQTDIGSPTVTVAGVDCNVTYRTTNQIQCQLPLMNQGVKVIQVTNPDGQKALASDQISAIAGQLKATFDSDFGATNENKSRSIKLENTGEVPVTLTLTKGVVDSVANVPTRETARDEGFTIVTNNPCSSTLSPGDSCNFTVKFWGADQSALDSQFQDLHFGSKSGEFTFSGKSGESIDINVTGTRVENLVEFTLKTPADAGFTFAEIIKDWDGSTTNCSSENTHIRKLVYKNSGNYRGKIKLSEQGDTKSFFTPEAVSGKANCLTTNIQPDGECSMNIRFTTKQYSKPLHCTKWCRCVNRSGCFGSSWTISCSSGCPDNICWEKKTCSSPGGACSSRPSPDASTCDNKAEDPSGTTAYNCTIKSEAGGVKNHSAEYTILPTDGVKDYDSDSFNLNGTVDD